MVAQAEILDRTTAVRVPQVPEFPPDNAPMVQCGQLIGPDYVFDSQLRGTTMYGNSVLWHAHSPISSDEYVVKAFVEPTAADQQLASSEMTTHQMYASEEGCMPIIEATTLDIDSQQYRAIVMPRAQGNLRELSPSYAPQEAILKLRDILPALSKIHSDGLVFRDIKSDNVLINQSGDGELSDFGLIARLQPEVHLDDHRYRAGERLSDLWLAEGGSPGYVAPESIGTDLIIPESDIFVFGTIAYELATGRLPWGSHESDTCFIHDFRESDAQDVCEVTSDISKNLGSLIMACIDRHPATRPTAEELIEEFDYV